MPGTVIVIPCYNEAKRLDTAAFESFKLDGHEVKFLFVDDGSIDATCDVLAGLKRRSGSTCDFIRLARNMGKAEAVRHGFLKAFAEEPEYVGFWDADLATSLSEIGRLCLILGGKPHIEAVFGSRVMLLGRRIERKFMRHLLGRVFATVVSLMLNLRVYDTQCGAKIFRSTKNLRAIFSEPFVTTWVFDVEILARWRALLGDQGPALGEIIHEEPVNLWRDVAGSKISPKAYIKSFFQTIMIYRKYVK